MAKLTFSDGEQKSEKKKKSPNLAGGKKLAVSAKPKKDPWGVRHFPLRFEWVPKTKEARARKRLGSVSRMETNGHWALVGLTELNDKFEMYIVKQLEDGNYACSCQEHAHGDTRGLCSHQLAVAIWEFENYESKVFPYVLPLESCFLETSAVDVFEEIVSGNDGQLGAPDIQGLQREESGTQLEELSFLIPNVDNLPEWLIEDIKEICFCAHCKTDSVKFIKERPEWDLCVDCSLARLWEVSGEPVRFIREEIYEPWEKIIPNGALPGSIDAYVTKITYDVPGYPNYHIEVPQGCDTIEVSPIIQNTYGNDKTARIIYDYHLPQPEVVDEIPEHEIKKHWYDFDTLPEILSFEQCPQPGRWALPKKITSIRPHQFGGLREIVETWHSRRKFVFVSAPTGSGKTNLGVMAAMEIVGYADGSNKSEAVYICTDRNLQDQFWEDFEFCLWSAIIKGRRNYPTANFPGRYIEEHPEMTEMEKAANISCDDCEYSAKKTCVYCSPQGQNHPVASGWHPCLGRCPFKKATQKMIRSTVGCMNTSFFDSLLLFRRLGLSITKKGY